MASTNKYGYQGQIRGYCTDFSENLINKIKNKLINTDVDIIIVHLGVQTEPNVTVRINNKDFKINKSGILEFSSYDNDCEITSVYFPKDAEHFPENDKAFAIIDYTYKYIVKK